MLVIHIWPFWCWYSCLRETCLLIDPTDSSSAAKQYVALVVGKCRSYSLNSLVKWLTAWIDVLTPVFKCNQKSTWNKLERFLLQHPLLQVSYLYPLHPNISKDILHTVPQTFLKLLSRRICVTINSFFSADNFLYSHDLTAWFRGGIVRRN